MRPFSFFLCLVALFGGALRANACSVPVFRYALERWMLSKYEVLVFHQGKLSPEQQKEVDRLEGQMLDTNIDVTLVDLAKKPEPRLRQIWAKHGGSDKFPWVMVRYPQTEPEVRPLYAGSLVGLFNDSVLHSPLRQKLLGSISSGETAIVLLLNGKDAGANQQVKALLQRELPRLEKEIRLPEQSSDGPQIESKIPFKVSFRLMELDRDTPNEKSTINMLLETENLSAVEGPIAFLIFGRGRILCGLHGEQLKPLEIEHALRFLCGKCSCQVKELNPGLDMLITADWKQVLLAPSVPEAVPAKTEVATPVTTPSELPAEPLPPPKLQENKSGLRLALGVTIGVMVLSGLWWLLRKPTSD